MSRVNLDAMIPRADLAAEGDDFIADLFQSFPISNLEPRSPIQIMLRKPDFQRETYHWSPFQVSTFIASFLDNELIPSLILWKSPTYIFVIDGGHRLSALRAWMEDDYGDGALSQQFYHGEISTEQKRVATRTRRMIEKAVGRFSTLKSLVGNAAQPDSQPAKRANRLFTRSLSLQWVQGNAEVAETSFFKINSQGTPLDDTEETLLRNRRKPIAIGARAIVRAGQGHKYWSAFENPKQKTIQETSAKLFRLLFQPEIQSPIKTLDIPLGGSVSPVNALDLLIEFLAIANSALRPKTIGDYADDENGDETVEVLQYATRVLERITRNQPGSLGLHPAVYFYNEKGKHSRFLFLGFVLLVAEAIERNNKKFFFDFTKARHRLEAFLVTNKNLLGILLQNMNKATRVHNVKSLLSFIVEKLSDDADASVTIEEAIEHIGARGRIIDIQTTRAATDFSDDVKSTMFLERAIAAAISCPICGGLLDPDKSVSYDHIVPLREGGLGAAANGQLVHPYCNTGMKG